jgi:hypothetical protein
MPPNRTRPIIIRVAWSHAEYAQVAAAAEATTGGNVSEYVRRKTLAEDGPGEVAELRAKVDQLAKAIDAIKRGDLHIDEEVPYSPPYRVRTNA